MARPHRADSYFVGLPVAASRRMPVRVLVAVLVLVALAAPAWAQSSGPWDFFRENIAAADSVPERVGVVFLTIVMLWLGLGRLRLLVPIVLVAAVVMAARSPAMRRSIAVRAGFAILVIGVLPLLAAGLLGSDNALGAGMVFAFAAPIGLLVILVGTAMAMVKL